MFNSKCTRRLFNISMINSSQKRSIQKNGASKLPEGHEMVKVPKVGVAKDKEANASDFSVRNSSTINTAPRLSVDKDSKVPWKIRQSFLEKIWSLLQAPLCERSYNGPLEMQAEALQIEKEHYEKYGISTSSYKNFAANYLVRVKDQAKGVVKSGKQTDNYFGIGELSKLVHSSEILLENGYILAFSNISSSISNSKAIQCERCKLEFEPKTYYEMPTEQRSKCKYHRGPKKSIQGIRLHNCCQNRVGEPGCLVAEYHVYSVDSETIQHFEHVSEWPCLASQLPTVAIDAEMVYTTMGMEAVRISGVNWKLETVIDLHCQPQGRIVDYNTFYSGITEESLSNCSIGHDRMRQALKNLIGPHTVIIGHSLENDLEALGIITSNVIDTSILFPHPNRAGAKLSLRELVKQYLGIFIQEGSKGHDSIVDARSCMQLVQIYLQRIFFATLHED